MRVRWIVVAAAYLCCTAQAQEVPGIWQASHLNNTVSVQGTLVVTRGEGGWSAEIAGETVPITVEPSGSMRFALKQCACRFEGSYHAGSPSIAGQWYQAPTVDSGLSYASPVTLARTSLGTYAGEIHPLYDPFTFFLKVSPAQDGTAPAFLANPERDLGNLWKVSALKTQGTTVALIGGASKNDVIATGLRRSDGSFSLDFDERGGTYDFSPVARDATSAFYPRGRPSVPYTYAMPPQLDDGWRVADVESVGISKPAIEKFVQFLIDTPMEGPRARQIHAILIARHGKLVVEEYFHGMRRDGPHDPRSASKSITATLFGAAMLAGFPVSPQTRVYEAMNGGSFPANLDPLKAQMTVESLLTMSSGWDCDDNDDSSPGSENNMSDNLHVQNWYDYSLSLKMIRPPGTQGVYCSIQPNMVGGVLVRATRQNIPNLFRRLVAEPMQIHRYYVPIQANGDAYMGGGLRLLPRDFLKFPQVYMNGGRWNGRRIVSKAWAQRATTALVTLKYSKDIQYGYLWWIQDFHYAGRTYRAFSMLGAGGQTFTAIPALDLVVGFDAGDYMHHLPHAFNDYVPQYILPAIVR